MEVSNQDQCRKFPRWIIIEARAKMIIILFFVHFFRSKWIIIRL